MTYNRRLFYNHVKQTCPQWRKKVYGEIVNTIICSSASWDPMQNAVSGINVLVYVTIYFYISNIICYNNENITVLNFAL